MEQKKSSAKLKREITLIPLILYGVGNIIGAGIYALIGEISAISGYFIPLAFLFACIIVLFTALSYAELSSRYPLSAGVAVYTNKAFKSKNFSTIVGLFVAFNGMLFAATIIQGFNGYITVFADIPDFISSFLLLCFLCGVAIWGIEQSVKVAAFLTIVESLGLFIIIYVGVEHLPNTNLDFSNLIPAFNLSSYHLIILGAFLAFFAFTGFEDIVNIAEEVKEPNKTMPKAIVISLFICTIIYMMIAFLSITVIEPDILAKSQAPLADVYKEATGNNPALLGTIGMLAMINGALIQLIMVSRIFFGMSVQGWFPSVFQTINPKTQTPIVATITATVIVYIFTLWMPLLTLAELTSFFIFIIFTIVNISLIKIKLSSTNEGEFFSVPLLIPITAVILNITMLTIELFSIL